MYWIVLRTDRGLMMRAKERHESMKENEWTWFEDEETIIRKDVYEKTLIETGQAPVAKPNFTFKMKIVLGFFQITTNLAFALDIPWPTNYQEFITSLGFVNFDFIQW